jgi:hypothetical protein
VCHLLTDGVQGDLGETLFHFDRFVQVLLPFVDQLASAAGEHGHKGTELLVLECWIHCSAEEHAQPVSPLVTNGQSLRTNAATYCFAPSLNLPFVPVRSDKARAHYKRQCTMLPAQSCRAAERIPFVVEQPPGVWCPEGAH